MSPHERCIGAEKRLCVALRMSTEWCVSKKMYKRSQADTDSWNGLFDTQVSSAARVFSLSQKRADTVGQPTLKF
jgi:hypothetical protein